MKRSKQYAFLGLTLGLLLMLTPTHSFASRYLAVGHRTDDPTAQIASMDTTTDSSAQLGSETVVQILVDAVIGIL